MYPNAECSLNTGITCALPFAHANVVPFNREIKKMYHSYQENSIVCTRGIQQQPLEALRMLDLIIMSMPIARALLYRVTIASEILTSAFTDVRPFDPNKLEQGTKLN